MNRTIFLILLLLFSSVVFAEGKVTINNNMDISELDLSGNLFYLCDIDGVYQFQEVLSNEFANKFTQAVKSEFYFPRNTKVQWFKLEIQNQSEDIQELVFGINNPLVQKLTVFSTVDSGYFTTGALFPYHQRQVDYNNFHYNIKLDPGQSGLFCIRIDAQKEHLYLPFTLSSKIASESTIRSSQFINGLFYALVIITLMLLLILWSTEKTKMYIYFFLMVVVILLFDLWRSSTLFQLLWPALPNFNLIVGKVLPSIILVSVLLFLRQLSKYVQINEKLNRVFTSVIYFALAFVLIQFIVVLREINIFVFKTISILVIAASSYGAYLAFAQSKKLYKRFAVVLFVIVVYLMMVTLFGFDVKGFGASDLNISKVTLAIFFVIVAGLFINKFRSSRAEVTDLSKNLEQLVEKRTLQLNSQKEELKSQHEELLLQKETLQTQREELRAQKELLEIKNMELEKLSLVASKTDNLIYIFKPDGELDWFNSSFSLLFGMTHEEYKRGEPKNIVDLSLNKNIRHVLNTCLREKAVVSYESEFVDDNNQHSYFHTTLTPILDKNDDIRLLIAIDTNITKLKQYEFELNDQRKDAEEQKNLAIKHKEELEERQTEITDSIRYAKRIQSAIMPKVKQIQRDFPDSFVLFLPKDIVSGDFYWYHRIGDKYFIAAVDCTGHGVPGAFMSIIGTYLLNSIIIHNQVTDPAEILKQLNRKIKIAMKTDGRVQTTDGMDISVAVVDKTEQIVEYAGALRPMYLFNQGDFIEIKGDKIPISSSISGITLSTFKTKTLDFKEGDAFYLFSDGIIDQFGGERGKKFLTKRFKKLLFEINELPMVEQKESIKKAFDEWKATREQVDDILVMGIKF